MKKSRYTDSQILAILKQAKAGTPLPELCREHGVSSATFYKWRSKHGGVDASLTPRKKKPDAGRVLGELIVSFFLDIIPLNIADQPLKAGYCRLAVAH